MPLPFQHPWSSCSARCISTLQAGSEGALPCLRRLQALCQRLALQALASDEVSASLHSDVTALAQVHTLLWQRAAQSLERCAPAAARELFAAAFQFARPEVRAKTARAVASCHSRLGMHQRAAEWLDIAAHHEQQPSSLTQLARLQQLALTGDASQVGCCMGTLLLTAGCTRRVKDPAACEPGA